MGIDNWLNVVIIKSSGRGDQKPKGPIMAFTPDTYTLPAMTNTRGVEIKLGDLVVTKGSKIVRVVQGISATSGVRGVRHDGKDAARSAWLDADKLTVIGSVL